MTTSYDFWADALPYIRRILVAVMLTSVCVIYPLIKRMRVRWYVRKNVIPFFKKMQTEHDAKCPIMMMNINAESLNMMPYDANKACIFFTDSKFIIKNIFGNTTYIEIPFTDITFTYVDYSDSYYDYYIGIHFTNENKASFTVTFQTEELTKNVKKAYGEYLYVDDFVRKLKTFDT